MSIAARRQRAGRIDHAKTRIGIVLALAAAQIGCSADTVPPAPAPRTVALTATTPRPLPARAVGSRDERGVPRLIWDTSRTAFPALGPGDAARAQLARHGDAYGLSADALATLRAVRTIRTSAGATVTTLRQVIAGDEVYGSDTNVLLRPDGSLVAIMGSPHAAARSGLRPSFPLGAGRAVNEAVAGLTGDRGNPRDLGDLAGGWRGFDLAHPNMRAVEPARARRVLFADGDRLRPAYVVELVLAPEGSTSSRAYRRFVAADDGSLLRAEELTASDAFSYKVWAAGDDSPLDGPHEDFSPHPTGVPDLSKPDFILQSTVSIEGFNSAPGGGVDPWLPAAAGVTTGNNADAYTDRFDPDGFTLGADFRADATAPGQFHHTFDTGISALASTTQTKAAIVQAFYAINWMHDYWYDSGFDEKAGNAQQDNFERGGEPADRMLVEVQDNADIEIDNANMSTPADGTSPRMQIYVWTAAENRFVTLTPGGQQLAGNATFGPQTFDQTGDVALVVDGTAPTSDACQTISNGPALSGKVVLIDRGMCDFIDKARAAQAKNAVGVIIANNVDSSSPPSMGATRGGQPVTIPVLSITKAAGDALKTQLTMGTVVSARLFRAGGPLRDGALDTTVITHEWGHYLHHRLVAGCGNDQCNAISEGWGDFVSLHKMVQDGDNLAGTYTIGGYAGGTDPNSFYHGIRRTPYTTDFAKNPLTFRHIGDNQTLPAGPAYNIFTTENSEVHNAGEIWAQMMYEAYISLLEHPAGRTFAEVKRDMADYVVAGMALTPSDATFTEQRDAILAAAAASSPPDFVLIAEAFAVRGAGTCAVSPARASTTMNGVVESFELSAAPAIGAVGIDDEVRSCDEDGLLDAQERGHVFVEVLNAGAITLGSAQVQVTTATPGVTFPAGNTATVGPLDPHASGTAQIVVALAASFPDQGSIALDVTVTGGGCVASLSKSLTVGANRDEVPDSSTTDTVESDAADFTATGALAAQVWSRLAQSPSQHLWHGIDLNAGSDTQLESPDLDVGPGTFSMSFQHHYRYEASMGKNWDGSVIEVSQDGGSSWEDASMFAAVPYNGTINTTAGNPLGGRQGFTKSTASYPSQRDVTINFGTSLSNRTVKVRFRIGTDEAVGDDGWFIDNISFSGLTNTPFHSVVNHLTVCLPPVANAGPDQTVATTAPVTLDASGSTLGNGSGTLTYSWSQTSGPAVVLSSTTSVSPTFTSPAAPDVLIFEVVVSDGVATTADSVMVTVVLGGGPDAAIPPDDAATPPDDAATTPPDDASTTPPADASTTPPADASTTPPADASTTPPADASTTPPADASTTPPADASTKPPADASTTPPADASTTPPADASTTPPADAGSSTADARATDAKVGGGPDAMTSSVQGGGGCGCSAGSKPPGPLAGLFLLLVVVWRSRSPRGRKKQ